MCSKMNPEMSEDRSQILDWLLQPDADNPGVRYAALRELLSLPPDDTRVLAAERAVMESGPVPRILAAQQPDGSWGKSQDWKYTSTAWQVVFLAELGADPEDERVRRACTYVLSRQVAANGGVTYLVPPRPSRVIHCGNGLVVLAMIRLGYFDDERVHRAIDWQARAILGEDGGFRYYKSATSGPSFACGINLGQPCAWGANKALRALLAVPADERSSAVKRALAAGADFLLSRDPAVADYPYTERVSSTWFRFGFPLSYWSDVLETVEVLADLGYGGDSRVDHAIELIEGKRDKDGRWRLENSLNGKMWADIEGKGQPSKWVTLRALRTLRKAGRFLT